ncbi:M20/M25/M40 family metallo-hydrolase, partial [bacterium]|nr:M20/M25/M40 family metallo-hydrolase [bacterium]
MAAATRAIIDRLLPDTERFLAELIRFPSTPGQEHEAMLWLEKEFQKLGLVVERVFLSEAIKQDPDYSDPVPDIKYDGRFNLRVVRPGTGGGKKLLVNAHTDVVPPSEGMANPWTPRVENGILYGRGACDDKGQVALAYLLLRVLNELNTPLAGDVVAHLVVEEENGGNGTLAMARTGEQADGCVVLEATEGKLLTSSRGAVWFRVRFQGRAGHSGQPGMSRSALLMARDAIAALEKFHAELLAASKGIPLFDDYANPMPITFGKLHAGNWPATAPSQAVLEGVLGLLPNKTKEQVMDGFRAALQQAGDDYFRENIDIHFMYRHDSSVVDPQHPLPQGILTAAERADAPLAVAAMPASCDAWLYNNQLGIPTVVYGPGSLKHAHSKDEQIALAEIGKAAEVL